MNKDWSEKNKQFGKLFKKTTFKQSITQLLELRHLLMQECLSWRAQLSAKDFSAIPFINVNGYHSKTIAYSIWHIFRIEDIVVNTLIRDRQEILFELEFDKTIGSPIITTGNELVKNDIAIFSEQLNIDSLYEYAMAVKRSTDLWLETVEYNQTKMKFCEADKQKLINLNVVSSDDKASWLINYWCNKDVAGLIKMPLSRHWIMHIEAAIRIKNKLQKCY